MPGIDPDSVNFLLADLARLFRAEFERRVTDARLGVTPAEARVLAHVARGAPIRQHLLAERLGVAQMSLTGFLDRLQAAGLVERVSDPEDRRAKRVRLTPAAEAVLEGVAAAGAAVRAQARAEVPDADWERFRATAARMRDTLAAARDGRTRGAA
ncbi:MarR family transcriptional regulator [uncultured Amaricoccus sp.]|uniref:MarR family winged helix-turn-helix transcriptional regulator n=1 Tax=uncultured Amaricoccus sp. TaxID=339341 RepID=UPI0026238B55|nr:MarR family transcriptional regulator [uncultured Amaricoccus sp.]